MYYLTCYRNPVSDRLSLIHHSQACRENFVLSFTATLSIRPAWYIVFFSGWIIMKRNTLLHRVRLNLVTAMLFQGRIELDRCFVLMESHPFSGAHTG